MPLQLPTAKDFKELTDLRSLLAFGSGIGIEIGADTLEVIAARVRPSKIEVLGRLLIENYAARPAAEWGAEYARFLKSHGMGHLSATVLLPRREVIVRQIALPGVAGKDIESAIRFQMDTLHPYGEEDVVWGSSRLEFGSVLVGIVRRQVVDRYRIAVQRGRHSGQQLHVLGRRGARRHPPQRRRARRRDSSRWGALPRAASRSTAKARRVRSSPPSSI